MLDELRDLFLRALKFDSKDKFDRIPLIREWNEAVDHVQEVFNHMTDKDQNLVPVVRCGYCKYWKQRDNREYGLCVKHRGIWLNSDFCSKGEHKDGGHDDESEM